MISRRDGLKVLVIAVGLTSAWCDSLAGEIKDAVVDTRLVAGKEAYLHTCAGCHGATLGGIDHAPALIGATFWAQWDGKPARKVYSRIISTMPANDPGSLTEQDALNIALFVMKANGLSAEWGHISTANDLNTITIDTEARK